MMDETALGVTTTGNWRRAALPAAISRPAKRASTRETPGRVTAHVRVIDADLDDEQLAHVRRKLGMKLGKFASSIERVSVRVSDVNGPRGGVDQRCRVKVVLSGLPSVMVERRDVDAEVAIDRALRATEESVRRVVRRRRMKPLHRRAAKGIRGASY
jgi:ribosome-associated translation inhibitor RaiA